MVDIWPTYLLAEEYLRRHPERFRGRTLLVGVKRLREVPFCAEGAGSVVIVEPWAPNAAYAREHYQNAHVIEEPVEQYMTRCQAEEEPWPDVVVWLQGPEHVPHEVALATLETFRLHAQLVLAEMPNGRHVQGADGGNPFEVHRSYLYADDFDPKLWDTMVSYDLKRKEDLEAGGDLSSVRHLLVVSKAKP